MLTFDRLRGAALGVVALAVALIGCGPLLGERGPLAPPSPPVFLGEIGPRRSGPLRPVTEADVHIRVSDPPLGTVVLGRLAVDWDARMRFGGSTWSVERRLIHHEGRARSVQALGPTGHGTFVYRVDYLRDRQATSVDGKRRDEQGLVDGKSYLLEMGPRGRRVLAVSGGFPPAGEASLVLDDTRALRAPHALLRQQGSEVTAERITAQLREGLARSGMVVERATASFKGARDVGDVPCAVFDIAVDTRMHRAEPESDYSLTRGQGAPRDEKRAAALHEKACDGGEAHGCAGLGLQVQATTGAPAARGGAAQAGGWREGAPVS